MELRDIKGFGEKRIQKLNAAGIFTPMDLISRFPVKYIDTASQPDFDSLSDGDEVAFSGKVVSRPFCKFIRRGLSMVRAEFLTGSRTVTCSWFNQRYVARNLAENEEYYIIGKVKRFSRKIGISAPVLYKKREGQPSIIPIYRTGVPGNVFAEAVGEALSRITVGSYLPPELSLRYGLLELNQAFRILHNPTRMEDIEPARRTVALENLSYLLSIYTLIKQSNATVKAVRYTDHAAELRDFISKLPYELTADQQEAVHTIVSLMHGDRPMNALLQGDVGCGKTIVAFLAMYYAALSGYQSVLMAPTEILARQHYRKALELLEPAGLHATFLSGSQSKAERDNVLFQIKNGMADIIIGTHSLIKDSVEFCRPALIITDEQHRFGVHQRGTLENKTDGTDCIVMSATPIPRTLALTLYGDLNQIVINTLPQKKASVTTKIVPPAKVDDMYRYLLAKAEAGEKSYIVCPRVEEDEESELVSAVSLFKTLSGGIFKGRVGLLHGQMKDCDKNETMRRFTSGEIMILVATTVIEVGIDVPEATSIVIFNADRYGLSQLHQLRGRVGRGTVDSYCFILSDTDNAQTRQRLDYLTKCADGFALAEYDFEMRGAGDFIGTRQHGESETLASVKITAEIISAAKDISAELLQIPSVCEILMKGMNENRVEFIKCLTLN